MTDRRWKITVLLVVAVATYGCGSNERPYSSSPPRTGRNTAEASMGSPIAAATYIATAGSIDLLAIRASEIALQRSSRLNVRDVAQRLIASHKGTSAQLSIAGRRLNLLPSASLNPLHRDWLEKLLRAPDFDRAYATTMQQLHNEALKLNLAYSRRGASPTLRPVAANAIAATQRNLRLLSYL